MSPVVAVGVTLSRDPRSPDGPVQPDETNVRPVRRGRTTGRTHNNSGSRESWSRGNPSLLPGTSAPTLFPIDLVLGRPLFPTPVESGPRRSDSRGGSPPPPQVERSVFGEGGTDVRHVQTGHSFV